MNLSLKQKAIIQTLGMLATCTIAGVSVALFFQYFTINTIVNTMTVGLVVFLIYIMYQINLSQLKYKDKLQEMVDKK